MYANFSAENERAAPSRPKQTVAAAFGRRHHVFSHFSALNFAHSYVYYGQSAKIRAIISPRWCECLDIQRILQNKKSAAKILKSALKNQLDHLSDLEKRCDCTSDAKREIRDACRDPVMGGSFSALSTPIFATKASFCSVLLKMT